jgi:hypothetical protein
MFGNISRDMNFTPSFFTPSFFTPSFFTPSFFYTLPASVFTPSLPQCEVHCHSSSSPPFFRIFACRVRSSKIIFRIA